MDRLNGRDLMRGLPDFGSPLAASCFAGFDQPGSVVALPDVLSLATGPADVPRLVLERFRGATIGATHQSYGLVSGWFQLGWPNSAAGRAVTTRTIPDSGVLTVQLNQVNGEPAVIGEPMAWDGSLAATWGARVTPETITWMAEALRMRLMPFQATATLTVAGVAPRLPIRLTVDGPLLNAIVPSAPADALTALVSEVANPLGALRVNDGSAAPELVASVILDRLNSDLPRPVGTELWDLSRPFVTRRTVSVSHLITNQLAAAPFDEATMIPAGTELPTLELGWQDLDVLSNLPARRAGVLACLVTLTAPPRPPARHQAAIASCELTPSAPRQRMTLALAPGEQLAYVSQASMVVDGPAGVREIRGQEQPRETRRLILTGPDFGVRFANVSAEPALLALATVEVRPVIGTWQGEPVLLDREVPEVSVVIDSDGAPDELPQLRIHLHATASDAEIALPDRPAEHCSLVLAAMPGWGPHKVSIINNTADLVAIELSDDAGTTSEVIGLPPDRVRTWTYLATDPFRPGYRYRMRPVGEPGPWSEPSNLPRLVIGALQ